MWMSHCLVCCRFILIEIGNTKAKENNAGTGMALSKDELRKIRQDTEKGKKADAIILSKNELDRIKGASVVTDKEE
jgi:hypothetical protein